METKNHKGCLGYTCMDDGVWVRCECGWEHNLGWSASPAEAEAKYREHIGTERAMEKLNVPIIDAIEDDNELVELQVAFDTLKQIVLCRRKARNFRLKGAIETALRYEREMDALYKRLPEWARW